ncbi:hypothetical protein [Vreelandella venusta]|uniref:hypothetical protein n=1 Tax=Vreelandella venusta TaxID=44935 RepID=UPI00200C0B4E|nr:hypothetical protein [Halomonas venusta]UQI42764.1 hypothetical protein M3L73_11060 [Halomonas venusta]
MSFDMTAYDMEKVRGGVWHEIHGGQFKIAYLHNKDRILEFEKNEGGKYGTPEDAQLKQCLALAEEVLRDWREIMITDSLGKRVEAPFSITMAADLLNEHREIIEEVVTQSLLPSNFMK